MSRMHYVKVARLIADEVERINVAKEPTRAMSVETFARGMADIFAADNGRFDRQRFYFAAGVDENGRVEPDAEREELAERDSWDG